MRMALKVMAVGVQDIKPNTFYLLRLITGMISHLSLVCKHSVPEGIFFTIVMLRWGIFEGTSGCPDNSVGRA